MKKLDDVLIMCDNESARAIYDCVRVFFDNMLEKMDGEPNLEQEFEIMDKAYELIMQTRFIKCKGIK